MELSVRGIPTAAFEALRAGAGDANGQPPQVHVTRDAVNPCRHCLGMIGVGEEKLVLSYRPFPSLQPYAECGPIFLHQSRCTRYESDALPPWFAFLDPALVRGYDRDDWIRYDTGAAVAGPELDGACRSILSDPGIAYLHVRSKFGCFQCHVDRA